MIEQIAADLACFLRSAQLAPAIDGDFALAKVSRLEAAWQVDDMDDAEAGRPEDLKMTALQDGRAYPELDRGADVHWYAPDHISDYLRRPRRTPTP